MPSPRIPLVAGNWKMHGLSSALSELAVIAEGVARGAAGRASCAICPPATLLAKAVEIAGPDLAIGGQDCAPRVFGAHTGDLSAEMLKDAGARYVIVGHSERRENHGETDALVLAKAEAAFRAGLTAILCVGETREERDAGRAFDVVGRQVEHSVPPASTANNLVLAYEPVWAIGTGLVPTVDDVAAMHQFLRERLQTLIPDGGAGVRILYGGSVKPDNAAALLAINNVDGALVGGASLKANDFLAIAASYH